jgi:hypothetical protein
MPSWAGARPTAGRPPTSWSAPEDRRCSGCRWDRHRAPPAGDLPEPRLKGHRHAAPEAGRQALARAKPRRQRLVKVRWVVQQSQEDPSIETHRQTRATVASNSRRSPGKSSIVGGGLSDRDHRGCAARSAVTKPIMAVRCCVGYGGDRGIAAPALLRTPGLKECCLAPRTELLTASIGHGHTATSLRPAGCWPDSGDSRAGTWPARRATSAGDHGQSSQSS